MKRRFSVRPRGNRVVNTETCFESLEPRYHLAVVTWDGGPTGNGTVWSDPANWEGDVLPTADDDVVLAPTGTSPPIRLNGATSIRGFTLSRELVLDAPLQTSALSNLGFASALLRFSGGRLSGGMVITSYTNIWVTTGGTLADTTILGTVTMGVGGVSLRMEGSVRVSTIEMQASGAQLNFASGTVLSDTLIRCTGTGTGPRRILIEGESGGVLWGRSVQLTASGDLGGDVEIRAASPSGTVTLYTAATIQGFAQGRTVSIAPAELYNTGTIHASGSTIAINSPTWVNLGVLRGGSFHLGGTFTPIALGTVDEGSAIAITGTFDLAGATFATNLARLDLRGGTITSGVIQLPAGRQLFATAQGGVLRDVRVEGETRVGATSSRIALDGTVALGTVRLTGSSVALEFLAGAILDEGHISFEGPTTGTRTIGTAADNSGAVVLGAGVVVETLPGFEGTANLSANPGTIMTLVNRGLIRSQVSNRPITVRAAGGLINEGMLDIHAGAVIAVNGTFGQTESGRLISRWSSTTPSGIGRLTTTSATALAGTLEAVLVNGFEPPCFATLDIISSPAGSIIGDFSTLVLPTHGPVHRAELTLPGTGGLRITYRHAADFNRDGALNADDLADFINDFFAGGLATTDFNRDGVNDADDLADFVNAFFTPC